MLWVFFCGCHNTKPDVGEKGMRRRKNSPFFKWKCFYSLLLTRNFNICMCCCICAWNIKYRVCILCGVDCVQKVPSQESFYTLCIINEPSNKLLTLLDGIFLNFGYLVEINFRSSRKVVGFDSIFWMHAGVLIQMKGNFHLKVSGLRRKYPFKKIALA